MLVGNFLELAQVVEQEMVKAFTMVAEKHTDEPDVYETCSLLAKWSKQHLKDLEPFAQKYPAKPNVSPPRMERMKFDNEQKGSFALMRDLQDLWLLATEADTCWLILAQAAAGLRDDELKATLTILQKTTKRQIAWLQTRIKQAAPQTLIVGI